MECLVTGIHKLIQVVYRWTPLSSYHYLKKDKGQAAAAAVTTAHNASEMTSQEWQ